MARNLEVSGISYIYPDAGEDPGWGSSSSDWAEAVTNVLNDLNPNGSIQQTQETLNDNQSSLLDINGFIFDGSQVKSAYIEYTIERQLVSSSVTEMGYLFTSYNGGVWSISRQSMNGDSGIDFDITSAGQVQYKSTSTGHSATLKYRAKTLLNQ